MANSSFVAHSQFLSLLRQFSHRMFAGLVTAPLERHQIGKAHAPMFAGPMEGQHALFQQLHQMGAGDVEQVSGLLSGQLGMDGYDL